MLPSNRVLSKLLGSLYDAAADPALWDDFLKQLADNSAARSAALVMHDKRCGLHTVARNWAVDPHGTRLYQEHYGAVDIWATKAAGMAMQEWQGTSEQLCSAPEFSRSEYYNDFLRPLRIEYAAFALLERTGNREATIGLYRGPDQQKFRVSELGLLRFLTPHIRRAFSLHLHFSHLKEQSAGMETALNAFATGVVLLGAGGKILVMNRSAESIVGQNDGLIAVRGELRAQRPFESSRLVKLIYEVDTTSAGTGLSAGGSLLISRAERPCLQVVVTPVRNFPVSVPGPVRAIAFVSDPIQRMRPSQDVLRALFGLTPAECGVALLIADGNSPREIAQTLGVSANTLKSHIASIYAKTNTSRQSQLLRLLLRLPADHATLGGYSRRLPPEA
jgi:DNA-binding CsgD family transcriptional regulator/PAS domain-containing protein